MGFNANVLKMDKFGNVKPFTFILSTKNYNHLGQLNNVKHETVDFKANLNGANELSFEVYKEVDGEIEKLWNDIIDLKSVYVPELKEYFEIKITYNDKLDEVKMITATSLCEAELKELNIYDTEINTENDISRPDYEITKFYNPDNTKASLLHRILKDKAPHYTIKHVDKSLWKLQKSFSVNGVSIYDFLTSECAEQFNCIFIFNSIDRSISVYDLYTECNNCGYRGTYSDICPECGSHFLNYFGNDTTIYIDKENFTSNIKLEVKDAIKNCFRLVAGDDIMTTTIKQLNQNGSSYLYYIPNYMKKDMSDELVKKIEDYNILYDGYTEEYQQLLEDYYKLIDDESYYTCTMMPEAPSDDVDTNNEVSVATKEASKLTKINLSSIGLTTVSESTKITNINNAIRNYAKIFVNTGKVRLETEPSSYNYIGEDSEGWHYAEWIGKIKVTNYSDDEDVAYSDVLTIKLYDNYEDYLVQKVKKDIAVDEDEYSIFVPLEEDDLEVFKDNLTYYCLNRLTSFYDALNIALETLMEADQASEGADFYEALYTPYRDKLDVCQLEIDKRNATINEIVVKKEEAYKQMSNIQKILNFENYLGEDLFREFCTYRREQEYNNSNYISDGLDNSQIINNAKQFIESAKKELYKSAIKQNSITTDLYNLLIMPEFKPLTNNFALGNFIRVKVDDIVYRLRLIYYEINFSDLSQLQVEFSDTTETSDGLNDINSILNSAKSVGNSFGYVSQQAEKGAVANTIFEDMYQNGQNSALYAIKNNSNEEITIDKGGITCKSFDDVENEYSPEQLKITHNILCYSSDGFRTVSTALGKHNYYKFVNNELGQYTAYGVCNEKVISSIIEGGVLC